MFDDKGTAYGLFAVFAFLLLATAIYILTIPMMNAMSDEFNDQIDEGGVSLQAATAFGFGITIFKATPIFVVVGVFLWAIIRALEEKEIIG